MLTGIDGFSADLGQWHDLQKRHPQIDFTIAIIEGYARLRQRVGVPGHIDRASFVDRVRQGWQVVQGDDRFFFFFGIFRLTDVLTKSALQRDDVDSHHRYLLDMWEEFRVNRDLKMQANQDGHFRSNRNGI